MTANPYLKFTLCPPGMSKHLPISKTPKDNIIIPTSRMSNGVK